MAEIDALGRGLGASPTRSRWVRPLRGIVCTLATQHETAEIVAFEIDGIAAGDVTWGHRFMAPQPIHVRRFDDYVDALQKAKVVLDADRRKAIILADAKNLAFAQGLTLVEDEGLLEEVAGLVEWPVVLMGEFEAAFLDLPAEVIRATIRANQKCFVLREAPAPTTLPPSWPALSRPSTGRRQARKRTGPQRGTAWMAGTRPAMTRGRAPASSPTSSSSSRTSSPPMTARRSRPATAASCAPASSDARHFWQTDLAPLPDAKDKSAKPLDQRLEKLDRVVFHEKLGTQGERIERIEALARELAPKVGARRLTLRRVPLISPRPTLRPKWSASSLSCRDSWAAITRPPKARSRASLTAIEEHYKPQGPNDRIPTSPVSIAVALADKLDTLVGFWAIDEKPTGSKDPYALRRAALGVIRIVLENDLRLNITPLLLHPLRYVRLHGDIALQRELQGKPATKTERATPQTSRSRWPKPPNSGTDFGFVLRRKEMRPWASRISSPSSPIA